MLNVLMKRKLDYIYTVSIFLILYNNFLGVFFPVSIFLKGEQMIPILNAVGTHAAVYGNHDFGN